MKKNAETAMGKQCYTYEVYYNMTFQNTAHSRNSTIYYYYISVLLARLASHSYDVQYNDTDDDIVGKCPSIEGDRANQKSYR